jgi:ATP-dependent Clp protease ATP-binding subunit ClpC
MFDRFTDRVRKVVELAKQEALRFDNKSVDTEHILLALLEEGSGVGFTVLKTIVDIKDLRIKTEKLIATKPVTATNYRKPFTPAAKQVFQYAIEEAGSLKDNVVGTA